MIEIERRLKGTLITKKPNRHSFMVTAAVIMLITLLSQFYWLDLYGLASKMPASHSKVFEDSEWWRLLTAVFIHSDWGHLLSNLFMLSVFSFFVFGYFGFLTYPVLALLAASLVNGIAVWTYPSEVRLLGASGLVYLLGGFWLCMYLLIQRQFAFGNRLLRVGGIAMMIFFPTTFVPTTSYRTHAIGFAGGVMLALFYFLANKTWIRSQEEYQTEVIETE